MFFKPGSFGVCLILIICCLVSIYYGQAQTAAPRESIKQQFPELQSRADPGPLESRVFVENDAFSATIDSDFYQTIIQNNLFAPLGTDLNPEPVLGEDLILIGTRIYPSDPVAASAWLKDTATGEYRELFLGDSMAGLMLSDIQPKQVTLEKAVERGTLRLATDIFLNAKRR